MAGSWRVTGATTAATLTGTKSKQFRMADCRLCHRTRKDEVADYPISGSNDGLRNSPHDLTADGQVLDSRSLPPYIAWCGVP